MFFSNARRNALQTRQLRTKKNFSPQPAARGPLGGLAAVRGARGGKIAALGRAVSAKFGISRCGTA